MIDEALMSLDRDAGCGKLAWVETQDDLLMVFRRTLRSAIAHVSENGEHLKAGAPVIRSMVAMAGPIRSRGTASHGRKASAARRLT